MKNNFKKIVLLCGLIMPFSIMAQEVNKEVKSEQMSSIEALKNVQNENKGLEEKFNEESKNKTHEELRLILKVVTDSINSGKYENMNYVLSKDIEAIPITSNLLVGKKEINAYFANWFGNNHKIKSLNMSLTPNKLTWINQNNDFGIVSGKGKESYTLNDGRVYVLETNWTASVIKEDGKWKIRSFNDSVNFLDNPILSEVEKTIYKVGIYSTLGGLLIGLILGLSVKKKK